MQLPDRAELERRGANGLTTEQGLELERPAGFRYISEDRRRAELDRRAEARGQDRRAPAVAPHRLRLVAQSEQERTRAELERAGMLGA